jgi:HD-like signal output (HDOD) protein
MPDPQDKNAVIRKLWSRINERGDFPMLSNSLRTTISAMQGNDYDFTALVQVVLSDFTLTQRVIRLANSAMYMAFGGNITTVSRALMVLGMEAVGHVVLGLKLVDHFQQSTTRRIEAKMELNRTMLASHVARKVSESRDVLVGEEAVVCTLMRQLGKLLCLFYLENEWNQIRDHATRENCDEELACVAVLGICFEELGEEVAERWGLPPIIREGMKAFEADPDADPDVPISGATWLQAIASFSTKVSHDMTLPSADAMARAQSLKRTALEYGKLLSVPPSVLMDIVTGMEREQESQQFIKEIDELRMQSALAEGDAEQNIRFGLDDLRSLPSENALAPVLSMASETVLASLRLSRTIVFVRDARSNVFQARMGLGPHTNDLLPALRFDESFSVDVFHLAISNSIGIFIENARDPKFSAHIPPWFKRLLPDAEAFVLLPVVTDNHPVALIYGDWNKVDEVRKILPHEMKALNELANELGRFFRHASTGVVAPL